MNTLTKYQSFSILASKLAVFSAVCLLLSACSFCETETLDHKPSPDGKVDAVVTRTNCGATTSFIFKVFIVPSGEEIRDGTPHNFFSDHTRGLEIKWVSNQNLEIIYDEADISDYQNFWHSRKVDNFQYTVTIVEKLRETLTE